MMVYTIGIGDFQIVADTREDALDQAGEMISQGDFSLLVFDEQ